LSILIPERKRARQPAYGLAPARAATTAALIVLLLSASAFAAAPGLDAYRSGKFEDAYGQFQEALKSHPQSPAEDKLQFDSGAAAYKLKDYTKALESFSQALLSRDTGLQSKGHYNLGNTLYQRGETEKSDDKKLTDWTNALDHYEQTLKLDPNDKEAKDNYDYVKRKIEELKNKKQQQGQNQNQNQQQQQQGGQGQNQNQNQQQQQQGGQGQNQNQDQRQQQQGGQGQQKPPIEPSEAAKKAKAEADKAVLQRKYRKALEIMDTQLSVDPTTAYYSDYIKRLQDINGIKKTDNS
jgi:Ca-activated chloride channel family protein